MLLASFGFLPSAVLVIRWLAVLVCLLVPMSVGRFRPAVCYARILWIAFVAVAGAASP